MNDYISRDAAKKQMRNGRHSMEWLLASGAKTIGDAFAIVLDEVPAADVRPVVRGKWMEFSGRAFGMAEDGTMLALKLHTCSECKKSTIDAFYTNFCPNCGADMRGEQDV